MGAMIIYVDRGIKHRELKLDFRSRAMRKNIHIHNLAYTPVANLDQHVPHILIHYLSVDVKFVRIHRNSVGL